jgi:hypothetical protein
MVTHRPVRLFAFWCALVVLAYGVSASQGWSPFANGPASVSNDGGGGGGVYVGGPHHK